MTHPLYFGEQQIQLFELPNFADLPVSTQYTFRRTDALYSGPTPLDLAAVLHWLNGLESAEMLEQNMSMGAPLRHELSPYYAQLYPLDKISRGRSKLEIEALHQFKHISLSDVIGMSAAEFRQFLLCMADALTGERNKIRAAPLHTLPDQVGNFISYPSAEQILPRLSMIQGMIKKNISAPASFIATLLLATIGNCHPLKDGNGRLSRCLYNWTMNARLKVTYYLPIAELSAISEGGFLIRLKAAASRSEWEALAKYFEDALHVMIDLQRSEMAHKPA